jgi:hypothetical protein
MARPKSLVFGVGFNDADYPVNRLVAGKQIKCNFYSCWANMIKRCYSKKFQEKNQTYIGCSVCPEWLTFSNFKAWMEKQDYKNKQLDKDLLVVGNKTYSSDNCVFVDHATNSFTLDCGASINGRIAGVCWVESKKKFLANCSDPFTGSKHLGYFDCKEDAYAAWLRRKHEIACKLADTQSDKRVSDALRLRYLSL